MINLIKFITLTILVFSGKETIEFEKNDAVVWGHDQEISGYATGLHSDSAMVYFNLDSFPVWIDDKGKFNYTLILKEQENKTWIKTRSGVVSDTLKLSLGYRPGPSLKPTARMANNQVLLEFEVLENPYEEEFGHWWKEKVGNPGPSQLSSKGDVTEVKLPSNDGLYFYTLFVATKGDTLTYETYVEKKGGEITPFDIHRDAPTWMEDAVVYQLTPYSFVENGKFDDIREKLHDIRELGINTLWLQPVFPTSYRGQGYDVVDYHGVNSNLGTEEELDALIKEAKALGLKVLFDVVLNHSSLSHPYAQERIRHGQRSHYYDFYQSELDHKPYSSHYTELPDGFVTYFWPKLVNFNYNNPEVQTWMIEACRYWVEKYDIDGYRLDAIWGVNSRSPEFAEKLRVALKSKKADLLLLAEDKGSDDAYIQLGYDAAYDWTADTVWVSQWTWEYEYDEKESKTIFNHPEPEMRGKLLRKALFENGDNDFRKLRFIENNDLHRFLASHGEERTKMAATLVFGIPGIPMLYNGQEVGALGHPYSTKGIFERGRNIRSHDSGDLYSFYQKLIRLRNENPALRSKETKEVEIFSGNHILALNQEKEGQQVLMVYNLLDNPEEVEVDLDKVYNSTPFSNPVLEDLLTGQSIELNEGGSKVKLQMKGYGAKWLVLKAS